MAFEATKRELGELYTFFRLLADGKVFPGTPDAQRDDRKYWPVALIQREEHDGTRRYYIGEEDVRIVSGTVEKDGTFTASAGKEPLSFPRADFGDAAEIILHLYNPQIQISAESGTKRSIFRQKNKTKRSKKRLHTTLIKPEQKVNEDLCSGFIVS